MKNRDLRPAGESSPVLLWPFPPQHSTLNAEEVHVWCARLDRDREAVQTLRDTLSSDELARAGRFYLDKDRTHFIVARGMLRVILARYLDRKPHELTFSYNQHGKPELADLSKELDIRFNISHSNSLALYAVTYGREIGVDLEAIYTDLANLRIAKQFFSFEEVAALCFLPTALQTEAFFNCWTRKEAYVKARGEGLKIDLKQFSVSLAPGQRAALLSSTDKQEDLCWALQEVTPAPGYVGAVAIQGDGWRFRCWQYPA
jgi:4'-phosphopantetheinyl transferase